MVGKTAQKVEMVPIDQINVVNPRVRNKKIFREIVSNIALLGLKKPITVSRTERPEGPRFELVCGQGRLEAYEALGQRLIPAFVIKATTEDCLVMSLVENLARRQHRPIDLLHDIEGLKRRGYADGEISEKTGLTVDYVRGIIRLIETNEHRLLRAVEAGQIPVSIAAEIASVDDADVQRVLQQAYDSKQLRGHRLVAVKRLLQQRQRRGKHIRGDERKRTKSVSLVGVLRTYQEDTQKKRALMRKADATKGRLVFVIEALRKILEDDNFAKLLRSEGLETLPRNLSERFQAGEAN
jgi:ParB family chromosome partitioning protein